MNGDPRPALRSDSVVTLLSAQVFDNVTTSKNSDSVDCSRHRRFLLHLDMLSTATPTDIRFIVQFSPDAGTTWHDYKKDEFCSLYYEDADLATEQYECLAGEVEGRLMRLRAVATGTTAANKFTITAKVEFFS